ncbi:hypothetical protein [Streptomyces sp. B8F3]
MGEALGISRATVYRLLGEDD